METAKAPEYRAEKCGPAWFCVTGDDFMSAADYDTEEEAQDAADEMNAAVLRAILAGHISP